MFGGGGAVASSAVAIGSTDLSPIEAARISAVLEDTLEKLSFLSSLTPDVALHKDEVAELTSGEVTRLITEQRTLEKKYEDLVAQRAMLKGAGNKARFKALQDEIQSVYYQLRESMKTMCRTLRENPDVSENVARIAEEREALSLLLEKTLTDLRDGHYRSLTHFVERERESRAKMRAAVNKEEEVLKEVDRLTMALKDEDDKHAADMETKRLELNELKERLRKLKIDTTLTLRYTRKEAAAVTEGTARAFTAEELALIEGIAEIRKRADVERAVHEQTLDVLKKEQEEYAKLADEWRAKYAADVAAAEAELARVTGIRDAQRRDLQRYQERYEAELTDLAEMEAAERARKEEEAHARYEKEMRHRCATHIQRVIGDMFSVIVDAASAAAEAKNPKPKDPKKKK